MPYVSVRTSKSLTPQDIESLKAALGEKMPLIPGKTESRLMVDIAEGQHLYHGGEARDLAFVEVRCFGPTPLEAKKAYAAAVFEALDKIIGVKPENVYYNHVDSDTWGSGGAFRTY